MIERLTLRDFKGHRDTAVTLSPLTLLVGPNGAGKTSVLEALHYLGQLHYKTFDDVFRGDRGADELMRHGDGDGGRGFQLAAEGTSDAARRSFAITATKEDEPGHDEFGDEHPSSRWYPEFQLGRDKEPPQRIIYTGSSLYEEGHGDHWPELRSAAFLRLDARRIAEASPAAAVARITHEGTGIATMLANLKLTDEARAERIAADLRRIVPQVERVRAVPVSTRRLDGAGEEAGYRLLFDVRGARDIPASGISTGTLLTLALVTILNRPSRPRVLLLDDVDQALHPSAQLRLVAILRELTSGPDPIQVIATSHSPYMLDAVAPEAVQVFALRPDGTAAVKPLSAHPDAAAYRGALSTGQLWTLDDEQRWVVGETG